jgi:hypothetical protein
MQESYFCLLGGPILQTRFHHLSLTFLSSHIWEGSSGGNKEEHKVWDSFLKGMVTKIGSLFGELCGIMFKVKITIIELLNKLFQTDKPTLLIV